MAIKISKVIADLNVGRQTIEEFLHKKGIEIDASINARIQDDVYEMLIKEFKPDMDLKSKSDKMANERQKGKAKQTAAKETQEIKTVVPGQKPTFLGKIDLDSAGKSKPAAKSEPEEEKAKAEKKEKAPFEKAAKKTAEKKSSKKDKEPEVAPEPVKEETMPAQESEVPDIKEVVEQPVEEVDAPDTKKEEEEVFKPVSETVGGPQLKVVGKVDLTPINQQTRPRKKSKEEKRNERIAKAQAEGAANKKKRKRIGKEQIDIEAAGNQASFTSGKSRGGKDEGGKRNKDERKGKIKRPSGFECEAEA